LLFRYYILVAIYAIKSIINFIMFATYCFYNEIILLYMRYAREQFNILKKIFAKYWSIDIKIKEVYFNIFKFYVISYYKKFIRKFDTINNFNIENSKYIYIYLIKNFYFRINKSSKFINQIYIYNLRRVIFLTINNQIK